MRKNTMAKIPIAGITMSVAILLGGCGTLAPEYERPEAPLPESIGKTNQNEVAATDLRWREFFTDSKLRKVVGLALENSRDLRIATLQVERARAAYGIQRASLYPPVDATAAGGKQRGSADLAEPGAPRTAENYEMNLGIASWELDIFGRIRSLKEQALQDFMATEEARRGARITLISELATAYLTLAANRQNLALAEATLTAQQESYELIERQYESRVANEIDLRRARTQVESAQVDVTRYNERVEQSRNALNLIAGSTVPEKLLPDNLDSVVPPKNISAGISSEVLLWRPDIMAAEHKLQSANAFIGAARAAFFPRIGLTTAIGTASDELSNLFGSGTDTWLFSPDISMPIFDPATRAAHRVSKADREIALARYELTIQEAFKEVADVLATYRTVTRQAESQQSLVDSAERIHGLAKKRYDNGIDSYLSVLDAQRSMYQAQNGLIEIGLLQLLNDVRLYAVLGGGVDYTRPAKQSARRQKKIEHTTKAKL